MRDMLQCDQLVYGHNNCYVWRTGSEHIGWEVKRDTLIRSQGNFNVSTAQWKKRTRSVVNKQVKSVSVSYNQKMMRCIITPIDGEPHILSCALRNGEVV